MKNRTIEEEYFQGRSVEHARRNDNVAFYVVMLIIMFIAIAALIYSF